jgi:DNA-binding transcriptional MerR regulator
MTVQQLAKQVGLPAHVVCYYTQCGLLRPSRSARNRYREYAETDCTDCSSSAAP